MVWEIWLNLGFGPMGGLTSKMSSNWLIRTHGARCTLPTCPCHCHSCLSTIGKSLESPLRGTGGAYSCPCARVLPQSVNSGSIFARLHNGKPALSPTPSLKSFIQWGGFHMGSPSLSGFHTMEWYQMTVTSSTRLHTEQNPAWA